MTSDRGYFYERYQLYPGELRAFSRFGSPPLALQVPFLGRGLLPAPLSPPTHGHIWGSSVVPGATIAELASRQLQTGERRGKRPRAVPHGLAPHGHRMRHGARGLLHTLAGCVARPVTLANRGLPKPCAGLLCGTPKLVPSNGSLPALEILAVAARASGTAGYGTVPGACCTPWRGGAPRDIGQ